MGCLTVLLCYLNSGWLLVFSFSLHTVHFAFTAFCFLCCPQSFWSFLTSGFSVKILFNCQWVWILGCFRCRQFIIHIGLRFRFCVTFISLSTSSFPHTIFLPSFTLVFFAKRSYWSFIFLRYFSLSFKKVLISELLSLAILFLVFCPCFAHLEKIVRYVKFSVMYVKESLCTSILVCLLKRLQH